MRTWAGICVSAIVVLAAARSSEATTNLAITLLGAAGPSATAEDGENYFETMLSNGPSFAYGENANSPDGSSVASASVGFGWARSLSTASHSAPSETSGSSNASTQSLFRDDITITAPGMSGGGTVTFLIDSPGGMAVTSSAESSSVNAEASWSVFVRSSTAPSEAGRLGEGSIQIDSLGVLSTGDQMGGMYEWGPLPFSFGIPFEITVALNAEVDVNHCCSATANFATLTWEGVDEMRDGDGALVSDFEITSGSGADFGEPIAVPEPAADALAIASLLTTALLIQIRMRFSTRSLAM